MQLEDYFNILTHWLEWGQKRRQEQRRNPSPVVRNLMQLKAEKITLYPENL
ncbi:hypothetical protein [Coleofasciculus sp. E1-EBD-02]|uniref:hypothetical protein n=1 Tax=Coleofasciculus sp. E1-EBD-02 TaxID=3068481 RepID=UPI0032F9CDBF